MQYLGAHVSAAGGPDQAVLRAVEIAWLRVQAA